MTDSAEKSVGNFSFRTIVIKFLFLFSFKKFYRFTMF
jgi:hypothetical protein